MRGASVARRWGWHRLDRRWAGRIVADAAIAPGELVLDVGAGDGVLTGLLVRCGARVIAVELHPGRSTTLRRRFAGRDVRIVTADAADLRLPRRSFSVVANPPFGISMALVRRLVSPGSRLVAADIVVPRHVALRWCGEGAGGAGRWAREYHFSLGRRIPASAFRPSVARDAVVLRIRRTNGGAMGERAFGEKRSSTANVGVRVHQRPRTG